MNEKITFDALISSVADKNTVSKTFSRTLIKEMALIIQDGLNRDGVVNLAGFGIFKIREVAARQGRDIRTGDMITIPAKKKVLFKPEKQLRELINKNYQHLRPQFLDQKPEQTAAPTEPEQKDAATFADAIQEKKADLVTEADDKKSSDHLEKILPEEEKPQLIEEKAEAPQPLNLAGQDEEKKSKTPILLAILAILIVLILFWQYGFDDQHAEETVTSKPAIEKPLDKKGQEEIPEKIAQKPPPKRQIDKQQSVEKSHQTKEGDNLWNLAYTYYKDGYLWPLILLENKDKITNPDFIKAGIKLTVPSLKNAENLSDADYHKLAQGHLQAYFAYRDRKLNEARNHLFVANKYDTDFVESNLSRIDAADIQVIKSLSMK